MLGTTACLSPRSGDASPPEALSEREPLVSSMVLSAESLSKQLQELEEPHRPDDKPSEQLDIIQMTAPIFYVEEVENFMAVDVMRLGSMKGRCSVNYKTMDGSAKAGIRYSACLGTLVFNDGEDMKTINVPILDNKAWAATMEFKVVLTDPQQCQLGIYLHTSRIKVIDNDLFPSSRNAEQLSQGSDGIHEIGGTRLFVEFIGLVLRAPKIRWRINVTLLLQFLSALNVYLQLHLLVYLVDVVLEKSEEKEDESEKMFFLCSGPDGGRTCTARVVACGFLLPTVVMWLFELLEEKLDYKGCVESFLKVNLFTKYLNYAEKSREQVTSSDVADAIVREAKYVTDGFAATIRMIHLLEKLVVYSVFLVHDVPTAVHSMIAMPFLMILGMVFFGPSLVTRLDDLAKSMVEMTKLIQSTCQNYQLISLYKQRPAVCESFEKAEEQVKYEALRMNISRLHLDRWAEIVGPLFVAWHIASKSDQVLSGSMSLGIFLATIRTFNDFSEHFVEMNRCFAAVAISLSPLKRFTSLLNMETDLMQLKGIARFRRKRSKEERQAVFARTYPGAQGRQSPNGTGQRVFRTDTIKMQMHGVEFHYPEQENVFSALDMKIAQGDFIAIVGQHGCGKATLMKLLGQFLFPTRGHIFMPSHLRTVYVPQQVAIIYEASAWSNLTFGLSSAKPERIKAILEHLQMPQTLAMVDQELMDLGRTGNYKPGSLEEEPEYPMNLFQCRTESYVGILALPHSEKAKIHLARALIMNPEVLVLQRPLSNFNDKFGDTILNMVREHVDNRGFALPEQTRSERRPRTVFLSPISVKELRKADSIWEVCGMQGIKTYQSVDDLGAEHFEQFHMTA